MIGTAPVPGCRRYNGQSAPIGRWGTSVSVAGSGMRALHPSRWRALINNERFLSFPSEKGGFPVPWNLGARKKVVLSHYSEQCRTFVAAPPVDIFQTLIFRDLLTVDSGLLGTSPSEVLELHLQVPEITRPGEVSQNNRFGHREVRGVGNKSLELVSSEPRRHSWRCYPA
ncbi:hypothetical protein J6590_047127 [Homalodisca vitripennis]|nr:hypothetical protein J6590_047127 [Homalodisca vitripennis]